MDSAIRRGTKGPPVMKAAVRADELAMLSYQRNMSVRRSRDGRRLGPIRDGLASGATTGTG